MEAESANPPRLFVLPRKATADARIVTLPHPRYAAKPTRFLVCPETGVYEFTQIASPKTTPRSWLITGEREEAEEKKNDASEETKTEAGDTSPAPSPQTAATTGFAPHTTQDADLFVATAVDPLFLVLPALVAEVSFTSGSDSPPPPSRSRSRSPSSSRLKSNKRMFLTADDHFDALPQEGGSHLAQLLRHQPAVRALFTARMAAVCDTVAAGDETMFRLNEDKLLLALLAKAQRTSQHLPASLEEKFVGKALEAPVRSVRSTAGIVTVTKTTTNGASTPLSTAGSTDSGAESQSSAVSTAVSLVSEASTVSTASTAATSVASGGDDIIVQAAMQASEEVVALQRLRVAFQFICSRYVLPAVAANLNEKLRGAPSAGGIDFAPLDAYLLKLAVLRQETALARSAALDYAGNKRGLEAEDDDERAEKRRKLQEEEKRKKANESRGVRDLKKVNVSGMKKLSEFFKKK